MKFLKALFFANLICITVFAQEGDSFEKLLQSGKKDTATINSMLTVISESVNNNPGAASKQIEKVKQIIEQTDYRVGFVNYYQILSTIYLANGDHENAAMTLTNAMKNYSDVFDSESKSLYNSSLGNIYFDKGELDSSAIFFDKSLENLKDGTFAKAKALLNRAKLYTQRGDYALSLNDHMIAYSYYASIGRKDLTTICAGNIGLIYYYLKDFTKAIEYYRRGIDDGIKSGNLTNLGLIYSNLGMLYTDKDSNRTAITYLNMGLNIAKKLNKPSSVAQACTNIGNAYLMLNNYDSAIVFYKNSLDICYKAGIDYGKVINYIDIGSAYASIKQYKDVFIQYDSALVYIRKLKLPVEEAKAYEDLADAYSKTGDYKSAFEYTNKAKALKDTLFNAEKHEAIDKIEAKYEKELRSKAEAHDLLLHRITYLGLGLFIIVLIGITLFQRKRHQYLLELYKRNTELSHDKFSQILDAELAKFTPNSEDEVLAVIYNRILILIDEEKIHLDPSITLLELASKAYSNEKYVSQAINKFAEMNFSNFINYHRITAAKELMINGDPKMSIDTIMSKSGFSSKSPFYKAFAKITGMSPVQFKKFAANETIAS